jgi:hypothetical protein
MSGLWKVPGLVMEKMLTGRKTDNPAGYEANQNHATGI